MTTVRAPSGLGAGGRKLWKDLHDLTGFNAAETAIVEEACRIKDRLDGLDKILNDPRASWLKFRSNDDGTEITVTIDGVLSEARQQANVLKQLIAALRLPEEKTGTRPQQRGGARGAYTPSGKAGAGAGMANVSSLERARAARGA